MWLGLSTSDWLGIGGMALAILGFGVTLFQLQRVKSAVSRQATRSAGQMLLLAVGKLERIERELRAASSRGQQDTVERLVHEWRNEAAEARALIEVVRGPDTRRQTIVFEPLERPLELSLAMVAMVLTSLSRPQADLAGLVRPLLEQMGAAGAAGRSIATSLTMAPNTGH